MNNELFKEFIKELTSTKRKGMSALISEMEDGGFFTAPCSGRKSYHLAEECGLMTHSMNVLYRARSLNKSWDVGIDDEHIIITALLHDLGKMGDHGKPYYVENVLKSTGKLSEVEPYKHNSILMYQPHECRSVEIASRHITLTEEESTAILYHNGLYGNFAYNIKGKEFPLYMLLHFSDMYASRVDE